MIIMEKDCTNCKHQNKSIYSEPCKSCRIGKERLFSNWEGNKMVKKSKSHRFLKIVLEDPNYEPTKDPLARAYDLQLFNIPNIVDEVHNNKTEIEDDDIKELFMSLCEYFQRKEINALVFDIDEAEIGLIPPKEMTIEEIEKQLGHKVKIVGDKK